MYEYKVIMRSNILIPYFKLKEVYEEQLLIKQLHTCQYCHLV